MVPKIPALCLPVVELTSSRSGPDPETASTAPHATSRGGLKYGRAPNRGTMRYLSDEWLENDDPADISDYAPREPGYISIIDDWDEDISTGFGLDGVVGYWD